MVDKIIFQRSSWFEKLAWSFCIIAVAFGLTEGFRHVIAPDGSPVIITRTEAINSPIHVGEFLDVRIVREKTRNDCSLRSERDAQDEDGKNYDLGVVFFEGGPAGTNEIIVPYPTNKLPPGSYHLRVKLAYICPERVYYPNQPDTRFRVIP